MSAVQDGAVLEGPVAPEAVRRVEEWCALIVHDRLAGNTQQSADAVLACVTPIWQAFQHVVVDVYCEFPFCLLESWSLSVVDLPPHPKADLKLVIRSMLCYSKFHAWRKLSDEHGLNRVRVSVQKPSARLQFGDQPPCPQDSPPAPLSSATVLLSVRSLNKPLQQVLPVASHAASAELPSFSSALPHAAPSAPVAVLGKKMAMMDLSQDASSPTKPMEKPRSRSGAASPDPRKRGVPDGSAPIAIPRPRSRLGGDHPALMLADGRIAPSPPARGPVDHRGVFVSPPQIGLALRHGSFSRSMSRTPPTQFLTSFEESLMAGRLPATSANPVQGFVAEISAAGLGWSASRLRLPLTATYYNLPDEEAPSPYVGMIDLRQELRTAKHPGMLRVPSAGLVQVMICNPERTGIKVFLIKYDFRAMPPSTHTFLRQRTFVSSSPLSRGTLRYAIHVRFVSSKRGHIYLHKDIRLIFSHRAPDVAEHQYTTLEGPTDPVFAPCDSFRCSPAKAPISEEQRECVDDSAFVLSPQSRRLVPTKKAAVPLHARLALSQ